MTSTKYKLGNLIQQLNDRNSNGDYGVKDVRGISIQKTFIDTKANMNGVSLKPYKLVRPNSFAYVTVTSRNGEKITLAHNTTDNTYIVSASYVVFGVSKPEVLLSDYLYIYFNRTEFDRFARFNSWGSARETFTWEDMCDIEIELPPIEVQKKYVDVYKSMVKNQECYESGLNSMKIACEAYIEELRKREPLSKIGLYCSLKKTIQNTGERCRNVKGIKVTKEFAETKADISDTTPLHNYKIVNPNEIVYVPNTARMGDKFACALSDELCCVSPIYEIINLNP